MVSKFKWELAFLHSNVKKAPRSRKLSKEFEYKVTKLPSCSQASRVLNHMLHIKYFFLLMCASSTFTFLLMHYNAKQDKNGVTESSIQPRNIGYRNMTKLEISYSKDFKYILLWMPKYYPFNLFSEGQLTFVKSHCSVIKCYFTSNRKLFGNNLTNFDVIVFDGKFLNTRNLPRDRSPHQKYMFLTTESADNYPVCAEQFEGYFNWTAAYRVDSDIPFPYLLIRDHKGEVIGPKQNMQWKEDMDPVANEFDDIIETKTIAAAWFASSCDSRNGRLGYVKALNFALTVYDLKVDVYGKCGDMECPKNDQSFCNFLLQSKYFFYLAMENSFDEDYVTEKLLRALQNDVIPIVYGGADYSRFLPPGSYIDARNKSVNELAAIMNELIDNPNKYKQYFRWKRYYTYHDSLEFSVCSLCKALHNKEMFEKTTIYENFRYWWRHDFEKRCIENVTQRISNTIYEQQLLTFESVTE